jgi:hypothetical protein
MLLSGRGSLVGPVGADGRSFVALRPDTGLVQVVGAPPPDQIEAAARGANEVLAVPEDGDLVRAALPGWRAERAVIHALPRDWRGAGAPADCRIVRLDDLAPIRTEDPGLADELETALAAGSPVGAAFQDGAPVSFCYACSVTEGLWDVSVDTIPCHRRRGYASAVSRFMIAFHARSGRRPVWGSAESNPPSARLAERLGFVRADELRVLTPHPA